MDLEWEVEMKEESRIRYKKYMMRKAYKMRKSAYSLG
jgi:hypothetical protein